MANLIETMPHADLIQVSVTMWAIWYARRKAIYKNIAEPQAAKPTQVAKAQVQSQRPRWLPPPAGCMQVNIDAAISKNLRRALVAAIA